MKTRLLIIIGIITTFTLVSFSLYSLIPMDDASRDVDLPKEEALLELYKDMPEVVAFYAKYNGTQVSIRNDHLSYFAGNENDFRIRMNLEFDENYEIENIELHCYVNRVHQNEVPQSFILKYLKDYTCDEYGSQRTGNIQIRGNMADQICSIMGNECPSYYIGNMQEDDSVMVGMVISDQEQTIQYQFFIKNDTLTYETINEN